MWLWDSLSHLPFSWACSCCLSLECSWNFITEMLRWTCSANIKFWTNQEVTCILFTSFLYLSFKVYWLLLFRSVWGESYMYVSTGTITCTCMWEGHRTQCWVSFLSWSTSFETLSLNQELVDLVILPGWWALLRICLSPPCSAGASQLNSHICCKHLLSHLDTPLLAF